MDSKSYIFCPKFVPNLSQNQREGDQVYPVTPSLKVKIFRYVYRCLALVEGMERKEYHEELSEEQMERLLEDQEAV